MLVQTSTTSKPNNLLKKKTSISDEQFTEFVANSSKSRCFDYYEKECKMPSDQMRKAIYKKCLDLVSSEYRVKGTRSGHINHAPVKIQDAYADAKKLIELRESRKAQTKIIENNNAVIKKNNELMEEGTKSILEDKNKFLGDPDFLTKEEMLDMNVLFKTYGGKRKVNG